MLYYKPFLILFPFDLLVIVGVVFILIIKRRGQLIWSLKSFVKVILSFVFLFILKIFVTHFVMILINTNQEEGLIKITDKEYSRMRSLSAKWSFFFPLWMPYYHAKSHLRDYFYPSFYKEYEMAKYDVSFCVGINPSINSSELVDRYGEGPTSMELPKACKSYHKAMIKYGYFDEANDYVLKALKALDGIEKTSFPYCSSLIHFLNIYDGEKLDRNVIELKEVMIESCISGKCNCSTSRYAGYPWMDAESLDRLGKVFFDKSDLKNLYRMGGLFLNAENPHVYSRDHALKYWEPVCRSEGEYRERACEQLRSILD